MCSLKYMYVKKKKKKGCKSNELNMDIEYKKYIVTGLVLVL